MHAHHAEALPAVVKAFRRENTRFSRQPAPRNHEAELKNVSGPGEISRGHFCIDDWVTDLTRAKLDWVESDERLIGAG